MMADKRGRPPLDPEDPSIAVHFRLPSKQYDAHYQQAQRERLTMSEWIRQMLRQAAPRTFVSKNRQ